MDQHTIRGLREEAAQEGRWPKALVSLHPGDHLSTVLQKLFRNRCSMAPVLTGPATSVFLHTCTTCTGLAFFGSSGRKALADMLTGRPMRWSYGYCLAFAASCRGTAEGKLGLGLNTKTMLLISDAALWQAETKQLPRPRRQALPRCTRPNRGSTARKPAPCCTLQPYQAC